MNTMGSWFGVSFEIPDDNEILMWQSIANEHIQI